MKRVFTSISILFIGIFGLFGQASTIQHIEGDVLVMLRQNGNIKEIADQLATEFPNIDILNIEVLSKRVNIWKIQFDPQSAELDLLLNNLKRNPQIEAAQSNKMGDFRNVNSNDPLLSFQWHHENDGSGQGMVGADIRSKAAWEISTGGLSPLGDTIVVAIIDAGFDISHEDLIDNLWINQGEIPDNGIDDDGNGYIDDYYGWNASDRDENITGGGSHGTQVNGMVGAKGNNEIGVAGVNWDIKIMQILLSTINEADVIVAYDYILGHRIRYNETGGSEGAYVVATNASWGIDFGKPEDAPLWCSFYDTLGHHGILSVGATANLNINVDEVGDLPTACPSEYLISVTSTNRQDNKARAGFGLNTIDLGAPGENVYTTNTNDRYTTTGGTSFASPLVAGTIGLLYSAPCMGMAELALADPSAAALAIKNYLIDHSDPLSSLLNRTKSGGRLNVLNSMVELMRACASCPSPDSPTLALDEAEKLNIEWEESSLYEGYHIIHRFLGSQVWDTTFNVSSPFVLEGLQVCSEYEVALIGVCADEEISFGSEPVIMRTDGCCEAPRNLAPIFIQPNASRISWRAVLPADYYIVEYFSPNTGEFEVFQTTATNPLLRRLTFCSEYQIRVAAVCQLDTTTFSEPLKINTLGCGACTETTYCEPPQGNSSPIFISRVALEDLNSISESSEFGYEDFTDTLKANIEVGESYELTVELDTIVVGPVNLRVWIDYNHNGLFNPEDELALFVNEFQGNVIRRIIDIPQGARQGTTRMRVAVWDADLNDTIPLTCGIEEGFFGEYEDYCVTLLPRTCPEAFDLDTIFVGFTQAEFEWTEIPASISYLYRHKKTTEEEYSKKETTSETTYFLSGLEQCTSYDFELRTVCLFDTSAYQILTFTTICPTNTSIVEDLNLKVSVNPNPFIDQFQARLQLEQSSGVEIKVTDLSGRVIYFKNMNRMDSGEHSILLDGLSKWSPGMYILEFVTDHGRTTSKIIKQ